MKTIFTITMVSLLLAACSSSSRALPEGDEEPIRINQVGFYPDAVKEFVVADFDARSFRVQDENGQTVFKGKLLNKGNWEASGENILIGDFTELKTPGKYSIRIAEDVVSPVFEIREDIYDRAFSASIKSYYYQRASMPIEEQYGGIYRRAAGHPDLNCPYHPSTGRKEGKLNSPGGWYDAGDYGKYVGNAAVSTGQMLNLLELYPDAVQDARLNIPESGNGISDLLDELCYELDWIITMQDTDGGVYHKLTAKNFAGFIIPEDYDLERLIIGKGTLSSLNFAAVMAQSSRICRGTDQEWSDRALTAAEKAWKWSVANNNVPFRNPVDVRTGEYGDTEFGDDFYWAAAELYVTTGKVEYLKYLVSNEEPYFHQLTNSWKFFVRNMAFHTLLANRDKLDPGFAGSLVSKHIALSNEILAKMGTIPYNIGVDLFEWGSNSDFLNQAMILCYAHYLTGDRKYLDGVIRNMDYIFGKNATGFCFLTGFGSKQVMNIHHRPSGADGIPEPVPGFIAGGPNNDRQDRHLVNYASEFPAKAYSDAEASFASNEVCLNWNAPVVFVMGYLEQVY